MVQKKIAKANNKHGSIQADTTGLVVSVKKQSIIKPSLQKYEGSCKSKVADLKAVKMKKSRSIKRANVDISLHSPQPLVTPAGTPSPKKALQCRSPCMSPNYMKSTSSSEARKEKKSELNSISGSSSKVHNKTSGMKKMRSLSLTKTPSFKHTRSSGGCKKVVLCQTGLDVQKATCSSKLKDSKFPAYLELEPGATEAEGNSVFKVCTYSYCSLNGHHHIAAPPLKRFLTSRRRLLKTMKVRPDVHSPPKAKVSECNKAIEGGDQFENFFVEVYAPGRQFDSQVSESLSDGPFSENEFQEKIDQIEVTHMSDMNFSPEGDYTPALIQNQASFESLADSLDDFYGENSDMVWEEGQSTVTQDNCEIYVQTDYSKDHDKTGFQLNDNTSKYLEFITDDQVKPDFELKNSAGCYIEVLAEECRPYFHEEILECFHFSDTDSLPESESTHTGDKHVEKLLMIADDKDSDFNNEVAEKIEDESMDKHGTIFSDTLEGTTVAEIREEDSIADLVMEEREPSEETMKYTPQMTDDLEIFSENGEIYMANDDHADNCLGRRSVNYEEAGDSNKVLLHSNENHDAEVKTSGIEDGLKNKSDSNKGGSEFNLETLDSCSKLKKVSRCRKAEEDIGEEKDFNPRGPNFLAVEPDQEAEKVDLRHQEMDEKRNAEEWMLDYALQKTVNQLATARKRKVALLVEAFESVRPVPKHESNRRKSSPGLIQTRTIQACS